MEVQKRMHNWMPFPDFDRTKPFSVPGKVRGMTSYYPAAAHECRSQLAYQHAAHTSELDSPLADRSRNLFADESKLKLEQSKQPGRANQRIVPFSKGPQARKEAKEQRKKGNLKVKGRIIKTVHRVRSPLLLLSLSLKSLCFISYCISYYICLSFLSK